MSTLIAVDSTPITDVSQLTGYMAAGSKPRERWAVGTEHEKLGWCAADGAYPTYDGPRGIRAVLSGLASRFGWNEVSEAGNVIALIRGKASVTLEPGGQLELSGAPLRNIAEIEAEVDQHLAEVGEVSRELGLSWHGLGYAPLGTPESMPVMPKPRYFIMRRYLPTRGRLALHMMHMTCTVQANYDFGSPEEAMARFRTGVVLQPLVAALFANSTVGQGKLLPYRTFRTAIWEETDPDRCLPPPHLLERGATLDDYVQWALDVPMFFIHREGRYVDCAGLPFRRFLDDGFEGHRANVGDFALHLSTLFPDVRLKTHLEVRGADMGSRAHVIALPALHKGLLYDDEAFASLESLLGGVSYGTYARLRRDVAREGMAAVVGGVPVRELLREVLRLSRAGLERLEPGAGRFLDVLDRDVAEGKSPADRIREAWNGDVAPVFAGSRLV
jgi:glutamate--cysteine ligase